MIDRLPVDAAAQPLLRAFHAQRPLRAGSLLITIFGDSVAPRGGEIALASLVALGQPFGLSERLIRTSVGRLAHEGWLQATRIGRLSYYKLTAHGRREFTLATQQIYGGPVDDEWCGIWTILLMPTLNASERDAVREIFRWRRFGQPMPGVLACPGDQLEQAQRELDERGLTTRVVALHSTSKSREADWHLARRAWNLTELEQRYRRFTHLFEPVVQALGRPPAAAATCFIVRTLLVHEFRRIHLRDPLLPTTLLPPSWTGSVAFHVCQTLYRRVFSRAEQFLSAHASNRTGPLPVAAAQTLNRFGGVKP